MLPPGFGAPYTMACVPAANYRYRRDNKSHMPPTASSNICKGATREQTCIPKVASKLTAPLKATLAIQTCIPKVARELTAPLKATRAPTTQEYINSYNFNTQCHNKHCASNITHICTACVAENGAQHLRQQTIRECCQSLRFLELELPVQCEMKLAHPNLRMKEHI